MPGSMAALLAALKDAAGKNGLPDDDEDIGKPVAAKLSVVHAKPVDGDGGDDELGDLGDLSDTTPEPEAPDEEADEQYNADMVTALQTDYPQIYDKLDKQVTAQQKAGPATEPDEDTSLSDLM